MAGDFYWLSNLDGIDSTVHTIDGYQSLEFITSGENGIAYIGATLEALLSVQLVSGEESPIYEAEGPSAASIFRADQDSVFFSLEAVGDVLSLDLVTANTIRVFEHQSGNQTVSHMQLRDSDFVIASFDTGDSIIYRASKQPALPDELVRVPAIRGFHVAGEYVYWSQTGSTDEADGVVFRLHVPEI